MHILSLSVAFSLSFSSRLVSWALSILVSIGGAPFPRSAFLDPFPKSWTGGFLSISIGMKRGRGLMHRIEMDGHPDAARAFSPIPISSLPFYQ
eukprot:scaffold8065_cov267-Pinguiococcus_pyrenoidosus.AAC.1